VSDKKPQPTIGVDFDGTLCDFAYPGIGSPKPGAKEALAAFRKMGYRVVIWTCRTCHYHYDIFGGDPNQPTLERPFVIEMKEWLDRHGFEYDEIDDGSRGKLHAALYIDDKGIRFDDNWPEIAEFVERVRPQ
jgi:hypothetical protein